MYVWAKAGAWQSDRRPCGQQCPGVVPRSSLVVTDVRQRHFTHRDPTRRCVTMAPYTNNIISARWHIIRWSDPHPGHRGLILSHLLGATPGQILYNFTPNDKKLSRAQIKRSAVPGQVDKVPVHCTAELL